jgi:hypothetical protein
MAPAPLPAGASTIKSGGMVAGAAPTIWKTWVEGVKGFGDLRLAVIIGECGDIGACRNPSCLWKRMSVKTLQQKYGHHHPDWQQDAAEA